MNTLSFVPRSATLRVLFIKARARLMTTCESAALTDERLIFVTEEMNKLADAIREASVHKESATAYGSPGEGSALMSQTDATALAELAQRRHVISQKA
jgi:hypothetical protein